MVRLPDRRDGIGDELTLPLLARAAGQQVPDAPAKVGASQQHPGIERYHDRRRQHDRRVHVSPSAGESVTVPLAIRSAVCSIDAGTIRN